MLEFKLLPWQQRALEVPLEYDLSLTGGRGGGKTFCLIALILQYLAIYTHARILVLRRSLPALGEFISDTLRLFPMADSAARYNSQQHVWQFSNGGTVELGYLDAETDFSRYQGRSLHVCAAEEAGQFPDARLLDLMRSCLRSTDGRPVRFLLSANPGGEGHGWIYRRYIVPSTPWVPFVEKVSGRLTVNIPTTLTDNEHISAPEYIKQLEAYPDKELAAAFIRGNWAISRGAFFADCLAEDRCMVDWATLPKSEPDLSELGPEERRRAIAGKGSYIPRWRFYLAHDWGSTKPSVTYWAAESPGALGPDGRYYPRGSVVLYDEYSTHQSKNDLDTGSRQTVPEVAVKILAICEHWGVPASGVADDAIFAMTGHEAGSIASEFARAGVHFEPANKRDRFSGWQTMRTMLMASGAIDRAGLFIDRRCGYYWLTAPFITRDPRRPEDVDSRRYDHGVDAARYALGSQETGIGVMRLKWASG